MTIIFIIDQRVNGHSNENKSLTILTIDRSFQLVGFAASSCCTNQSKPNILFFCWMINRLVGEVIGRFTDDDIDIKDIREIHRKADNPQI